MTKERGMILIQTVIFVVIFAIISVTMVEITQATLHRIHSIKQQESTIDSAQTALSHATLWLKQLRLKPLAQSNCNMLPCIYLLSTSRNFHDAHLWQTEAKNIGSRDQPSYFIIELLESDLDSNTKITTEYYQITAISWSIENHSKRIIQQVVSKAYDQSGNALSSDIGQQSWRLLR